MAERYYRDPNDFYALLDDIEIAARDVRRIDDNDRQTIIAALGEIRLESNGAKDEDLIKWDGSLRDCLTNMESLDELSQTIRGLLESAPENVADLRSCLEQIRREMESR